MRKVFEKELNNIENKAIEMGSLAQSSILETINYLKYQDQDNYQNVLRFEEQSDDIEKELQHLTAKMIITWQPVAKDLRFISAILKFISDLERINDQCVDICELYHGDLKVNETILKMASLTEDMLKDAMKSFIYQDINLARGVKDKDDLIDRYFSNYKKELVTILSSSESIEDYLNELMIAKYFERIGDHSVNISEWVLYYLDGEK